MSALLLRVAERLNPMLVKEVRQALNGRLFRVGYLLALTAAFCIAMVMLMSGGRPNGAALALAMFGCMGVSIFAFVPLSAFMSMGGEWDENTYDLLVLSNLTPRRIVWGKLGAAFVQTLVSFSAFLPFFVFAFLLRGVNLPSLLLLLGGALVVSPAAALVAIGLSSLTTNRFLRIVLLVVLVAGLFMLVGGSIGLGSEFLAIGFSSMSLLQQCAIIGVLASVALVIGWISAETACTRLAHPEENRSTGLRITLLLAVLGGIAWGRYAITQGADLEFVSALWLIAQFVLVLPAASFVTEPEPLGRRVAHELPRRGLLALLVSPLLPGGGRGVQYWLLLQLVLAAGALWLARATGTWGSADWWDEGLLSALLAGAFASCYVLLPTLLVRTRNTLKRRMIARVLVPISFLLLLLVPAAFCFFVDGPGSNPFDHPLDPIVVLDGAWTRRSHHRIPAGGTSLVPLLALAALALHLPRMVRGFEETLAAARARRPQSAGPQADGDAAAAR